MNMRPLTFELPKLDETHSSRVRRSRDVLKKRATSVGQRSSKLIAAVEKMKNFVGEMNRNDIASQISRPLDAKAFAKLFAHENLVTHLSDDLLKAIDTVSPRIKRQTLMLLIEGYLLHYDEGLDQESLNRLSDYIQDKLSLFEGDGRRSDLCSLAKNRSRIFSLSGPANIVTWSREKSLDMESAFDRIGLGAYLDGRYSLVCRCRYYLEELKSIPMGMDHKILSEISNKSVYSAPGNEMPCMGHEVLRILIDRSKGSTLSESWLKVILEIAGDPRVPENSSNYRQWWSHLGIDRVGLMRGWLSRLDLKLFLKILEDYGKSSGNSDLQRMYPARKQFLEGLIDHGLVTNSRLFINLKAESFLKRGYKEEDLPEYAKVNDSYRSMIYLQVGGLHMIEGSHNVKLWIFPKLPEASRILDYQATQFSPPALSSSLARLYANEFGDNADPPIDIIHNPKNFLWQYQAITYLRGHGIKLDIEKLFSKIDYSKYIRSRGL